MTHVTVLVSLMVISLVFLRKTSVVGSSIFVAAGACGLVPKRLDELPFVLGYGRVSERNLSSKKKGVKGSESKRTNPSC